MSRLHRLRIGPVSAKLQSRELMAIESFMNPEAKERFLKAQLALEQASSSSVSFDILPPGFLKLLRRILVSPLVTG